jgi:hypothetical protein
MESQSVSILKTENGFSVIDTNTNTLKCGHNYPQVVNYFIGCRKEIKDLIPEGNLVTYEFVDKLLKQENKTNIILPFEKNHIEEMINTKDPWLLFIKEQLEQNEEDEEPVFLAAFFRSWKPFIIEEGVTQVQDIIFRDFIGGPAPNYGRYLRFIHEDDLKPLAYDPVIWRPLILECEKNIHIKPEILKRVKSFFTIERGPTHFFLNHEYFISQMTAFIMDLAVTGSDTIWISLAFNIHKTSHSNQVLIDCTKKTVSITFFDPHLLGKDVLSRRKSEERDRDMFFIHQKMMEHFVSFVSYITDKKVTSQRKVIQNSCEIPRALQSKKDILPGLCSYYSILMGTMYLLNKKNRTLKGDYHAVNDDITCFFSLLGDGALNLLGMFFYYLLVRYPVFREQFCANTSKDDSKILSPVTRLIELLNIADLDAARERKEEEEVK